MRADLKRLSCAAYAQGWTMWVYRRTDEDDPMVANFWDCAHGLLNVHDTIMVMGSYARPVMLYVQRKELIPNPSVIVDELVRT